ncbi:MAG: 50S ribosomal protein L23 [Candidatus Kaiserbacteria bacterium]|nr:50S ribosomal protein L23 [Candidatus Kaiserbacteria bacterium]
MAIFGDKKKEVKAKKEKSVRVHHARAMKLSNGIAHEIIRAPWFSEKSLIVTEKGIYTFEVPKRATKAEIAGAIKEIYKVEPRKIRIVNLPGKKKAMRTKRGVGTRAARHKAYVYLNAGDSIQFS